MKFAYLITIISCFITSCAINKQIAPIKLHNVNFPDDNKTYEVEIGEPLLRKSYGFKRKAVRIMNEFRWSKVGDFIFPRQTAKHAYLDKKFDYYGPLDWYLPDDQAYQERNLRISGWKGFLGISNNGQNFILMDGNGNTSPLYSTSPNISYTEVLDQNSDFFEQEFIFNGKSENNIKFLYREFGNSRRSDADLSYGLREGGYKRPMSIRGDFSQEVQYDLSESNNIGFKGSRIEVVKATNQKITVRVLKSFD